MAKKKQTKKKIPAEHKKSARECLDKLDIEALYKSDMETIFGRRLKSIAPISELRRLKSHSEIGEAFANLDNFAHLDMNSRTDMDYPNFLECSTLEQANEVDMKQYTFVTYSEHRSVYIFKKRAKK